MSDIEEVVISLVQQHEHLYNSTTKSYRNSISRDRSRASIGAAVNLPGKYGKLGYGSGTVSRYQYSTGLSLNGLWFSCCMPGCLCVFQ